MQGVRGNEKKNLPSPYSNKTNDWYAAGRKMKLTSYNTDTYTKM